MSVRELVKRVSVAVVGVPVALGLVFLGGWALTWALALFAALSARELHLLGKALGVEGFLWTGIAGSAGMVLLAGMTRSYELFAPLALTMVLGVLLLAAAGAIWLRGPDRQPFSSVSFTVVSVLYGGGCLSFALLLRHLPETGSWMGSRATFQGEFLLLFPLAVTWIGDSAAYFFGHLMGNRKLIPAVSPGKTVVGGVAGLLSATAAGGLLGWLALEFHPVPAVSGGVGIAMGLVLGIAAQVGDLVESVLKREAGVKDSGDLFPGHGGVLDRFDAVFFTLPIAFLLVRVTEMLL